MNEWMNENVYMAHTKIVHTKDCMPTEPVTLTQAEGGGGGGGGGKPGHFATSLRVKYNIAKPPQAFSPSALPEGKMR